MCSGGWLRWDARMHDLWFSTTARGCLLRSLMDVNCLNEHCQAFYMVASAAMRAQRLNSKPPTAFGAHSDIRLLPPVVRARVVIPSPEGFSALLHAAHLASERLLSHVDKLLSHPRALLAFAVLVSIAVVLTARLMRLTVRSCAVLLSCTAGGRCVSNRMLCRTSRVASSVAALAAEPLDQVCVRRI